MLWSKDSILAWNYCDKQPVVEAMGWKCYIAYPPIDKLEHRDLSTMINGAFIINMTVLANDYTFQIITEDGKKIVFIVCSENIKLFEKELNKK